MGKQASDWTYLDERKKTKKLLKEMKLPSDPSISESRYQRPADIDAEFFPDTTKVTVLATQDEAEAVLSELERSGVTEPKLPTEMWQVTPFFLCICHDMYNSSDLLSAYAVTTATNFP